MKDLSICVPAYNRKKCLLELLATIVKQINDSNRGRVQVCVSDDCSPTDLVSPTSEFMKDYDVEFAIDRNERNLGFDRNLLKCVEMSNARYCWIVGDDDGIPDGKIDLMLSYIENHPDISVFFANRYVCNRNLKARIKERWTADKENFFVDFRQEAEIKSFFDRLNSITGLGYLALMVKKEAWDAVGADEYEPYIGTIYIQVAKYFLMTYKKERMYRIADYILWSRFGHDNFFGNLKQRIFMDFYGYLKLSEIFRDNPKLRESFLHIVRRHYDNVFLNAMRCASQLSDDEIGVMKELGYSEKQISIAAKRSKIGAFFGFIFSVIKKMFTDFHWFYKTCFVTFQKLVAGKRTDL